MAVSDEAQGVTLVAALSCATLSDAGTERPANEDSSGLHVESPIHVLAAVADGVSGEDGAAIASTTAIEVTLRAYRESPAGWGPAKRIYRAVQQANIEIHDRALVVTELRRMATTLTAVVVDGPTVHAAHIGDTRLYSIRGSEILQRTKDHTLAGRRQRMRLSKREKGHPDESTLTRCLGRELIAAVDRISFAVVRGDVLVVCSDGLYRVLEDEEIRDLAQQGTAEDACQALIDAANERGTPDNVTVTVLQVVEEPGAPPPGVLQGFFGRILGRTRAS
jgi:protein phosphatase